MDAGLDALFVALDDAIGCAEGSIASPLPGVERLLALRHVLGLLLTARDELEGFQSRARQESPP